MQRLFVGVRPSFGQLARIDDLILHRRIEVDRVRILPVDPHGIGRRIAETGVLFGELRVFRLVVGESLFGGAYGVLRRNGVDVSPLVRVHRVDLEIDVSVVVRKQFHPGVIRSVGGRIEHGVADRSSLQGLHQVTAAVHLRPTQAEVKQVSGQDRCVHHRIERELGVELDPHAAAEQAGCRIRVDDQRHSALGRSQLQRRGGRFIGVGYWLSVDDGNDIHDAAFSSVLTAVDAGGEIQAGFDVSTVAVVLFIDEHAAVRPAERDPGKVNNGLGIRHLQSPPFMLTGHCLLPEGRSRRVRPAILPQIQF